MKMSKRKFLTAAITMSLVLGVYGTAGAADRVSLYGVGTNGTAPETSVANTTPDFAVTTDSTKAGTTGANYSVTGGTATGGQWETVYGGYSQSGDVTGNTLTISGSANIRNYVYGGYSEGGNANGNKVTFSVGNKSRVWGGYAGPSSGDANSNEITITGGVFSFIYGGQSNTGNANENVVNISGDTTQIKTVIYGGDSSHGNANGNKLTISGGTISGDVHAANGHTGASSNTVTITGGTISGSVYGGESEDGNASNNTVTIEGGTITGRVFGGFTTGSGTASNNIINLGAKDGTGYATINGDVYIDAKRDDDTWRYVSLAGGMLNVYSVGNNINSNGKTLNGDLYVDGAILNFYVPNTTVAGDTMLKVAGTAYLTGATIQAGVQTGAKLKKGDKITLIDANEITGSFASATTMTEAGYNKYKLGINVIDNDLVAEVLNAGVGETAKSPVETQAAGITMLTVGGDIIAGAGMDSAAAAVRAEKGMGHKAGAANMYGAGASSVMTPFAVIGGNNMRVNSGSHVDLKSWNINVGFAKEVQNSNGTLLFGPVVEYGRGSYDSYVDTDNGTYHGDGNTSFMGLGFIAKQTNKDNFYYEGSLRVGRLSNDYSSADGSYDESATYYGLHAGVGQVFQVNAQDSFDCYAKLFWTHQNGINATIAGNALSMDAVNSLRSKLGFRYNHAFNAKNAMYAGLAWQDEFKGTANATLGGEATPAPSVKGNTGILELGWKNNAAKNLELDFGLKAYTGVQRGAGINAKLNWKF